MDASTVPFALFVYDRPELLERTLACLERTGARDLTVFSDGPRGREDATRVAAVRELVYSISWAEPVLVARDRNLGLARSIRSGLDELFQTRDRVVVVEDDIAVAPEFGAYAAAVLDAYADDERVAALTGLRMPFPRRAVDRYPYDAYMLPRFYVWGWATWRRAWRTFEFDYDSVLERLRASGVPADLAGADLVFQLHSIARGTMRESWAVYAALSVLAARQHVVSPAWNMVDNIGLESGTHPQRPRWRLRWEVEHRPRGELRIPPVEFEPGIVKAHQVFWENPRGWTPRRLVPRPLRRAVRKLRGTYELPPSRSPASAEPR
jgi:hypothetical protein